MASKKDAKKPATPPATPQAEGRKQVLPSLLAAKTAMEPPRGSANGNGSHKAAEQQQTAMQLDEYNALERLLEAGTPEDLDTRTELNELQILHFARAETMADYYSSAVLRDFVSSIKRKQISKERKGRREFTEAIKGAFLSDGEASAMGMRSLADRLRS